MKIAIFSKFEMCGGSEFRCVELANGLIKFSKHEVFLLAERKFSPELCQHIQEGVRLVENSLEHPDFFYEADCLLVVNTDTPDFSTLDYWLGKTVRHSNALDMERMQKKKMFFIYNFLISPSRHLHELAEAGIDVRIIPTNKKFFDEITSQDRYEHIRQFPRYTLESPIDPTKIETRIRSPRNPLCFGMHSKGNPDKWNDEIYQLISEMNKKYGSRIAFRFMGIKDSLRKQMHTVKNVTCLHENKESVNDFLSQLDVFLFFPNWKREEPWARVIAEAMVSGCPVIALNKGGTSDQVLNHHNGFLCKNYKDYLKHVVYFMEHQNLVETMSMNSIRIAKNFHTQQVIAKLLQFIND